MRDLFKELPCLIPLLFMFAFALPILLVVGNFINPVSFVIRLFGVLTFVTLFSQVMTGSFRQFLVKYYNARKVFKLHNILGVAALGFLLTHYILYFLFYNSDLRVLLFNAATPVIFGVCGLYLMLLTVISSDLKFFFNVKYPNGVWRFIHLLNYVLLMVAYIHLSLAGKDMANFVFRNLINTYLVIGVLALVFKLYKALKAGTKNL